MEADRPPPSQRCTVVESPSVYGSAISYHHCQDLAPSAWQSMVVSDASVDLQPTKDISKIVHIFEAKYNFVITKKLKIIPYLPQWYLF